ncbi:MAG: GH3 auxin-responsive promoter family protein [Pseudomonadota bacterium]
MIDATPLLRGYTRLRMRRLARKSAVAHQKDTLLALVRQAQDTAFGKDHGFSTITTVDDFQSRVPLRDFEDFKREYFDPRFPVLDDVTWPGRIPFFAVSSGTASGRTKHIPVSRQMVRSNVRAGTDLLGLHALSHPKSAVLSGKSFMLGGSVAMEKLPGGVRSGDLSGIARLNNPRWSGPFVFPSLNDALEADWERKMDRLARLSLKEPIRVLAGTPSWLLLFFERLQAITGGEGNIKSAYPGLELVVYGGMSFAPYRDTFRSWFPGDDVAWREVYSASEGFVAIDDGAGGPNGAMRLNLDVGLFYEFVPLSELESPSPKRYWLGNAPAGEYALVLSSCAGLWSYRIGDVVEFVPGDVPRVRVCGRTAYTLNAFGEHLSGAEIERALISAGHSIGKPLAEFSVTPVFPTNDTATGQHLFVVELSALPGPSQQQEFAAALDRALADHNEDYEVHRRGNVQLLPPEVVFVPPGAFAGWMRSRGKLGGQNKVPRVVNEGPVRDSLLAFARAQSSERV